MGKILSARAPDGSIVVLKIPHANDKKAFERMRNEAQVGLRIRHPAVVETVELLELSNTPVLVVSYIEGISLLDALRLQNGPFSLPMVARMGEQLTAGLHALHTAKDPIGNPLGTVHRDISTGNVMLNQNGDALLIDLGIAKSEETSNTTTQMKIKGTFRFLAPELFNGEPASVQSDIWSLGCVLLEAALGKPVFSGLQAEVIAAIVLQDVKDKPAFQNLPADLREIFADMFVRTPGTRAADAGELSLRFGALEMPSEAECAALRTSLRTLRMHHQKREAKMLLHPQMADDVEATQPNAIVIDVSSTSFLPSPSHLNAAPLASAGGDTVPQHDAASPDDGNTFAPQLDHEAGARDASFQQGALGLQANWKQRSGLELDPERIASQPQLPANQLQPQIKPKPVLSSLSHQREIASRPSMSTEKWFKIGAFILCLFVVIGVVRWVTRDGSVEHESDSTAEGETWSDDGVPTLPCWAENDGVDLLYEVGSREIRVSSIEGVPRHLRTDVRCVPKNQKSPAAANSRSVPPCYEGDRGFFFEYQDQDGETVAVPKITDVPYELRRLARCIHTSY